MEEHGGRWAFSASVGAERLPSALVLRIAELRQFFGRCAPHAAEAAVVGGETGIGVAGAFALAEVARHMSALAFQLPPRITRFTSWPGLGGPCGSAAGLSL